MSDPPIKRPKKLIICCDGTWMDSDIGWTEGGIFGGGHPQNPSNVTRIARALVPEDKKGHVQVVYYQNGIGTGWSLTDKFIGGALAFGLSENIRAAYGFVVNNYQGEEDPDLSDQLYFVGFSRGAYTARSVAGMIGCLGLLTKAAMSYFYAIFDDFENAGKEDYQPTLGNYCKEFKALNFAVKPKPIEEYLAAYRQALYDLGMTRIVNIKAIGVFDTVGSLGLPVQPWLQKVFGLSTTLHSYRFYDTGIGNYVDNAFQVLALDEHRSAFTPTVWSKADGGKTHLKQIWMPGVHTNAGGGANDNAQSDISLAWMMDQLSGTEAEPLLEFSPDYIKTEAKATREDYTNHLKKTWQWGLGQLGNSFVFPTSLAGSITRTPLNYYVTNYETGRSTGVKLSNTCEMIHASARIRSKFGTTWDGKPYGCKPLEKWEPTSKDGGFAWVAKDGQRLEEDKIGFFESQLLDTDERAAKFVETGE